jgi:putative phosphoesterase
LPQPRPEPGSPAGTGPALLGLLSDAHGRAETTRRAVDLLLREGAQALLFLGDAGSAAVIEALAAGRDAAGGSSVPVHAVRGNIDDRPGELEARARERGIAFHGSSGRILAAGKSVVFLHGHERKSFEQALRGGPHYLCHGHTHRQRDERVGQTRVVNPGALFRARAYTVALLDARADRVRFLEVPR